ncbi:MAG TPA: 50S ribosomal protein L15 [Candidatus Acidoferrum sp.]|nr:50S ribosomal protein L15 [Candidatus Acidoferrum sp.]
MKFHELNVEAHKSRKRVGRGISAGQGKTAGRGTKGQKARTGKKIGATFMGGQGPLVQRVPVLRGFKSLHSPAQVVYTEQLSAFTGRIADNQSMFEAGLIGTPYYAVKIILKGELTDKVTVKAQGASKGAAAAITSAGGSFEKMAVPLKSSSKSKTAEA